MRIPQRPQFWHYILMALFFFAWLAWMLDTLSYEADVAVKELVMVPDGKGGWVSVKR